MPRMHLDCLDSKLVTYHLTLPHLVKVSQGANCSRNILIEPCRGDWDAHISPTGLRPFALFVRSLYESARWLSSISSPRSIDQSAWEAQSSVSVHLFQAFTSLTLSLPHPPLLLMLSSIIMFSWDDITFVMRLVQPGSGIEPWMVPFPLRVHYILFGDLQLLNSAIYWCCITVIKDAWWPNGHPQGWHARFLMRLTMNHSKSHWRVNGLGLSVW